MRTMLESWYLASIAARSSTEPPPPLLVSTMVELWPLRVRECDISAHAVSNGCPSHTHAPSKGRLKGLVERETNPRLTSNVARLQQTQNHEPRIFNVHEQQIMTPCTKPQRAS
jgi:hypothetical protein